MFKLTTSEHLNTSRHVSTWYLSNRFQLFFDADKGFCRFPGKGNGRAGDPGTTIQAKGTAGLGEDMGGHGRTWEDHEDHGGL